MKFGAVKYNTAIRYGGESVRRSGKLPELLAPAGSFEALVAAVEAGADAVYVGGSAFGARAYAKNFNNEELLRAVRYCHLNRVKLYVTVNTLVNDLEMASLSDYAAYLYEIGVDAVIVADLGVIKEIRRRAPKLPIHASTQCSVHNVSGSEIVASLGCERVVPARELSLENIKIMVDKSPIEVEIFLHGALCVCHSGQCLMSSLVGGRSGNRGECAQPCRLPYNGKYPLSLKDLSLASHIPEIIESGVSSLKIEGRMKSPRYVYGVTRIYRRLLDEGRAANDSEERELRKIFSRDGFTDGYFVGNTRDGMTGVRSDADKESTKTLEDVSFEVKKHPVKAVVELKLGKSAKMTLYSDLKSVTVTGDAPDVARNAPLTKESVVARLSKMGNTLLSLNEGDIEITLDDGINMSPASLNALRRAAAEEFESCARDLSHVGEPYKFQPKRRETKRMRTAVFYDVIEYNKAIKNGVDLGYFDIHFLSADAIPLATRVPNGVQIPPVIFDTEWHLVDKMLEKAKELGVKYALVSNLGALSLAKAHGLLPIADFRLSVTNVGSLDTLSSLGLFDVILSPELTLPMVRDIGGGAITYGRIPLMITERCFMRGLVGCGSCSRCNLTDRTGKSFPVIREFEHRNIIFNSTPTYMGDRADDLRNARISHEHFIFSVERADEIKRVIDSYKKYKPLPSEVRRIGRR